MSTEALTDKRPVQAVLFACSFNSARSPMAEGLARFLFSKQFYVASAGVRRGETDGFAIAAMEEIGLDIARHRPQSFDDLEDANFDLIITLSPEAHHKALDFTHYYAIDVEYWPTIDPTAFEGSREQKLDAYREVRDGLMRRLKERFDWRPRQNL